MTTTYNLCVTLINLYKKTGQTAKLEAFKHTVDVYYAANRLTEAEYNNLVAMFG